MSSHGNECRCKQCRSSITAVQNMIRACDLQYSHDYGGPCFCEMCEKARIETERRWEMQRDNELMDKHKGE